MATFMQQFKILMWKNIMLKLRNKRQVLQEILYPIYFVAILIMIKVFNKGTEEPRIADFPSYSITNGGFVSHLNNFTGKYILVSPNTAEYQSLANNSLEVFNQIMGISSGGGPSLKFLADRTEMDAYYLDNDNQIAAGIIFEYSGGDNRSYALRFPTDSVPGTDSWFSSSSQCRDGNGLDKTSCDSNKYLRSGFALLQLAIDTAIIQTDYSSYPVPEVSAEMLPKPSYKPDSTYIQVISALYFVLAYSPFIMFLSVHLVAEKEKKIKEGMQMMGMKDLAFWLSWGLLYLVYIIIVTVVTVILAAVSGFFINSNVFLFFLILLFYGLSIITLAFVITPFFDKAQSAGGMASLATMLFSVLYLAISLTREIKEDGTVTYSIPPVGRGLMCLLSPCAIAQAIDQATFLDITVGMNFKTAGEGDFPLYIPLFMLLVDSILYLFLAIYLDNVIPDAHGNRKPPYYIFMKSYWFSAKRQEVFDAEASSDYDALFGEDVEKVSAEQRENTGIRIMNLTKEFSGKEENVVAVNNLCLEMYRDQITCLLGHNGAGKTTLINILSGLVLPTKGTAKILGMDINNPGDMDKIRSRTGVCPQHNILFDKLTVVEHLKLFAGLKGLQSDNIMLSSMRFILHSFLEVVAMQHTSYVVTQFNRQIAKSKADSERKQGIRQILQDVGLTDQDNVFAINLSGGQKRKLSVAIALIGDPKIVILDEPTAGIDPFSRRHLWAVLKEKKKGRVILLTTHFMDEADILADRKAFISKGQLRCCGSSLFLKSRFGIGYHLNMVVDKVHDTESITDLVTTHVEGARLRRTHGKEVAYTLPLEDVASFKHLFGALETKKTNVSTLAESLGIKSYGVSMTTLEEVFLKLEEDDSSMAIKDVVKLGMHASANSLDDDNYDAASFTKSSMNILEATEDSPMVTKPVNLKSQQFWALCKIRFFRTIRAKPLLFINLFLPVVFVVVGLIISKTATTTPKTAPGPLNLTYGPGVYTNYTVSSAFAANPPFLIKDSLGTTTGTAFIQTLMAVFNTKTFTNTSEIVDTSSYIGLDLQNLSVAASSINQIGYNLLYNSKATHGIPTVIGVMSNSLLSMAASLVNGTVSIISAANLPLYKPKDKLDYNQGVFSSVILVALAFVIVPPGFAVDLVKDRQFKIRSQLRTAGVPFSVYWLGNFFVDFVKFSIPAILSVILVLAIGVDSFKTAGAILSLILLLLTYMLSTTLFTYIFSFVFSNYETCQSAMTTMYFLISFLPYLAVSLVDLISGPVPARIMHYIFCIVFQPYNVFGGIYYIDRIFRYSSLGEGEAIAFGDYFTWDNLVMYPIIVSIIEIPLFIILLRILDIRSTGGDLHDALPCVNNKKQNEVTTENSDVIENEDSDVSEERHRVKAVQTRTIDQHAQYSQQYPVVLVENLRKEFVKEGKSDCKGCTKVKAEDKVKAVVRNTSFAVDSGEVLGLLGPNGAGKTTTLNMVIAELAPTKGKVHVGGYDVRSSMSEAFQALGYCPQHDALWDTIQLDEHLRAYAAIRGIPKEDIDRTTNFFIKNLKIDEYTDKQAKKLSGGTKRKLSYIISMLGKPKVVLMDEPSTGMDPQSKRFLWDTITQSFSGTQRGAILTTHYMEEADALCTRVAIVVNGKMECIGATQHLKNKFSSGYLLEVKLQIQDITEEAQAHKLDQLEEYVMSLFPNASRLEKFGTYAQFKVPKIDVPSLANVFSSLEEGKVNHGMEEYSFSQSTLEQVFIEFAKKQVDENHTDDDDKKDKESSLIV